MRNLPAPWPAILQLALLLSVTAASDAQEPAAALASGSIADPTEDILRLPPVDSEPAGSSFSIPGTATPDQEEGDRPQGPVPKGAAPEFGMGPPGAGPQGPFRYSAIWFPSTQVHGQDTNWGLVGEDLSLMCPLWTDPPSAWMFMASVRNRFIQTDAVMPTTGQEYPSELWSANLGLMYHRRLDNGWMLGGGVNLGSASDRPFASIREMNVGMNAMLRVPQGEHNAWMFSLIYSPLNELSFPIPLVAFNWNPSEQFHANIGLPFQMTYRPTDHWVFDASYMPIHTIHTKATYRFNERLAAFAGYDWSNEIYSLADRLDDKERFFMYDQRVSLGLEASLAKFATVIATGGYAFDPLFVRGNAVGYVGEQPRGHRRRPVYFPSVQPAILTTEGPTGVAGVLNSGWLYRQRPKCRCRESTNPRKGAVRLGTYPKRVVESRFPGRKWPAPGCYPPQVDKEIPFSLFCGGNRRGSVTNRVGTRATLPEDLTACPSWWHRRTPYMIGWRSWNRRARALRL